MTDLTLSPWWKLHGNSWIVGVSVAALIWVGEYPLYMLAGEGFDDLRLGWPLVYREDTATGIQFYRGSLLFDLGLAIFVVFGVTIATERLLRVHGFAPFTIKSLIALTGTMAFFCSANWETQGGPTLFKIAVFAEEVKSVVLWLSVLVSWWGFIDLLGALLPKR